VNRMFKKHSKGEKGFTMVELLIVFTLLAVLAAIMIPNVSGFVAYGHTQSIKAETSIIQTAMDAMMAKENISQVTDNTTSDWSANPAEHPLYPDYLRFTSSKAGYDFDYTGLVTYNATIPITW
jgi:prepilin-type N-terminal cleavage/methylation domain-containing protein